MVQYLGIPSGYMGRGFGFPQQSLWQGYPSFGSFMPSSGFGGSYGSYGQSAPSFGYGSLFNNSYPGASFSAGFGGSALSSLGGMTSGFGGGNMMPLSGNFGSMSGASYQPTFGDMMGYSANTGHDFWGYFGNVMNQISQEREVMNIFNSMFSGGMAGGASGMPDAAGGAAGTPGSTSGGAAGSGTGAMDPTMGGLIPQGSGLNGTVPISQMPGLSTGARNTLGMISQTLGSLYANIPPDPVTGLRSLASMPVVPTPENSYAFIKVNGKEYFFMQDGKPMTQAELNEIKETNPVLSQSELNALGITLKAEGPNGSTYQLTEPLNLNENGVVPTRVTQYNDIESETAPKLQWNGVALNTTNMQAFADAVNGGSFPLTLEQDMIYGSNDDFDTWGLQFDFDNSSTGEYGTARSLSVSKLVIRETSPGVYTMTVSRMHDDGSAPLSVTMGTRLNPPQF